MTRCMNLSRAQHTANKTTRPNEWVKVAKLTSDCGATDGLARLSDAWRSTARRTNRVIEGHPQAGFAKKPSADRRDLVVFSIEMILLAPGSSAFGCLKRL